MVVMSQQQNQQKNNCLCTYLLSIIILPLFIAGCTTNDLNLEFKESDELKKARNDIVVKVIEAKNVKLHRRAEVKIEIENKRKTSIEVSGVSLCISLLEKPNTTKRQYEARYSDGISGSAHILGSSIEIVETTGGGFVQYCVGETDTRIAPIYVPSHTKEIAIVGIVLDFPYAKKKNYSGANDYLFNDTINDKGLKWRE